MSTRVSRLRAPGWLVCAAIVVAVVSGCNQRGLGPEPESAQKVISVNAEDRLPNRTAGDLVTYADHVVLVTVTAEKPIPPSEDEIARGEGIVMRDLAMRVDDVLWSSPEDRMVGKSLADLQTALKSAKPLPKERFGPPPAPCPASS